MKDVRRGIHGLHVALLLAVPCAAQERVELPAADRPIDAQPTEVYSVGTYEGDAWETFGVVTSVAFDGRGYLYVMDGQNSRVVVVRDDGTLAWTAGRAGDGPEEWRGAGGMAVTRDGRLFVSDGGHRVYHAYDPDGRYVRAVPMDTEGGIVVASQLISDPSGPAFFMAVPPLFSAKSALQGDAPQPRRPIQRVALGERAERGVFFEAWAPPPPEAQRQGNVVIRTTPTFTPALHIAALPDGSLAVVDSSAYQVRIVDAPGREIRRVVRPSIVPLAVTRSMQEAEVERALRAMVESGMGISVGGSGGDEIGPARVRAMVAERLRNNVAYPELPVVRRIAAGWSGILWLERSRAEIDRPGRVDLFRADGSYLGTVPESGVRIPDAFGPEGLAAWIEPDDLGTPRVVVRRLPTGVR